MRGRIFLCALTLACTCFLPASGHAQSIASWIQISDSRDNPLIVEMIRGADLSTALEIAAEIGRREDADIREIILATGEDNDRFTVWEKEILLRTLLASVFPASLEESELEARLLLNREGLDFLVAGLPSYTISLKREIVRLLGYFHPPEYLSALMAEGRLLSDLLILQRGDLSGEQAGLALAYLETLRRLKEPEFADIVLLILERTRHQEVAQAAHSLSRSLLLAE